VGPTVCEQRIRFEVNGLDRCATYLARAIGAQAKSLQGSINLIQRRLDGGDTLVGEVTHGPKSTGE
jgi:hypothetical protein